MKNVPEASPRRRLDRVTLGQARAKAQNVRTLVSDGHHVTAVRRAGAILRAADVAEISRGVRRAHLLAAFTAQRIGEILGADGMNSTCRQEPGPFRANE